MKINPVKKEEQFTQLNALQRTTRIAAIVLAFIGVFVWFFKIIFF